VQGALKRVGCVVQVFHQLPLFGVCVGNVFVRLGMGTQPPNKYVNRTLRNRQFGSHCSSFPGARPVTLALAVTGACIRSRKHRPVKTTCSRPHRQRSSRQLRACASPRIPASAAPCHNLSRRVGNKPRHAGRQRSRQSSRPTPFCGIRTSAFLCLRSCFSPQKPWLHRASRLTRQSTGRLSAAGYFCDSGRVVHLARLQWMVAQVCLCVFGWGGRC